MKKYIHKRYFALLLSIVTLFLSACSTTKAPENTSPTVSATVTEIEKYGHAVLDITAAELAEAGFSLGDVVCVRSDELTLEMPYFDGYYSDPGELMLRGANPEKPIALCINYDRFTDRYGIVVGDTVEIVLTEKAGMLMVQKICSLQYTSNRADYADDATFANFRNVSTGRIGEGKLFRSASPVNNAHGRAGYANDFIMSVGVTTVLNLADSNEDVESYFAEEGFRSTYYRNLYETGHVITLDLGADFRSESFASSIANGLTFLSRNEPPYSIHCTEGKDRAGFTCMLLEALMGADLDQIIDDYMLSFYNYYGITEENAPERYQTILDKNLLPMMYHVTGAEDRSALAQIDLEAAVTQYLLNAGMTQEDLSALKEKLS